MSEQLETIKCVDWTINFPGAVGGGAEGERAHLQRQAALPSSSSEMDLDSSGQVSHAAIHPSQESYRSIILQTGHEFWPLHSFSTVNHLEASGEQGQCQCKCYWNVVTSVHSSCFSGIYEATVSIWHISTCDLIYFICEFVRRRAGVWEDVWDSVWLSVLLPLLYMCL